MKNLIMTLSLFLAVLFIGCQSEQTPVDPFDDFIPAPVTKISIPNGATIDSAHFVINVTSALNEEVTLHRVTADWDEMMVSWNNFAGSYDASSEGSFTPSTPGWYSVEVTSLLNSWLDDTYENYGILLKETSPAQLQLFTSREEGNSPYLIIWWTLNGNAGYDSTNAFADAYIRSDTVDVNYGSAMELITGWLDTIEVQSLVRFEIENVTYGCTRSAGYWKTHSIYGPAPYDTTWALLGEDSTFFLSNKTNYEVMWTPPAGGNAYYILSFQYIAAALNFLNGADPFEVQEAFDDATDLFEMYTPEYVGGLKGNNPIRQQFLELKDMLDHYNNGLIGPGYCNDNNGFKAYRTK
jgi:hypothetical protein